MAGKLYYSRGDPDLLKLLVLWEAEENASRYELVEGVPPKPPLRSGRRGLVLELPSGETIFSTNEICRLSCDGEGGGLGGGWSPEQQALVDYWLDWESGQLKSAVHSTVVAGEPTHDLLTCFSRLESHFSLGHHYIIPEGLSLADIAVWCRLFVLISPDATLSQVFHKDHPLVCQWFISLARLDSFTAAQWKGSSAGDHQKFILGKTPHPTTASAQTTTDSTQAVFSDQFQSNLQSASQGGGAKGEARLATQKKGEAKKKGKGQGAKGQGSKGQAKKEKERPSQQPVSGL